MINLAARTEAHTDPYDWAIAFDLIPTEGRKLLVDSLPDIASLERAERPEGGDKQYGMHVGVLVQRGKPTTLLGDLGSPWTELIKALSGVEYRRWVHRSIGVNAELADLDIGIFLFSHSDYITPHLDKEGKLATHVLYLNEEWKEEFGGAFEIRLSEDMAEAPFKTIRPSSGHSVLFARSERSWHSVSKIAAPDAVLRSTIQVEMWRQNHAG